MKKRVIEAIIKKLEEELKRQQGATRQSSMGAMYSAPSAEKQRDTTGLEAAYLAHGYARNCSSLAKQIEKLQAMEIEDFSGQEIDIGALVEVEMFDKADLYLLLEFGGGTEVTVDGRTVTVITPESPLGSALMGNFEAGFVSIRNTEGIVLDVF